MDSNNSYIEWSALRSVWFSQYHSLGQTKVVVALIENPGLYNRGDGLLVYTGVDPSDNTQKLLISYQLYDHLRLSLEAVLQRLDKNIPSPRSLHPSRVAWTNVTGVYVKSSKELEKLHQCCKKISKRLHRMQNAKAQVDLALSLLERKSHVFVSIDIEAYELDHSILLEIGWTLYDSKRRVLQDQHYMNSRYRHLANGKYVNDERLSFNFGTSVWCTLDQALAELHADLEWATKRDGGYVLVGHNLDSDIAYLRGVKFMWPCKDGNTSLDVQESAAITVLNTESMYGVYRNDLHNPPSLSGTLTELGIEHWHMHNAGNDAHYTMLLFLELMRRFKEANDKAECNLIDSLR